MGESVQVEGGPVGSAAEQAVESGGCCGTPGVVAVLEPAVASPCCGSSAQAEAEGSCCGVSAKAETVASGAGCCG